MSSWQDFEISCTEHLNRQYGNKATFVHQGGSNSKLPDIMVGINNSNICFGIEAKESPAQCGQFVLHPNISTSKFVFSSLNQSPLTRNALYIINHMNQNFEDFKEATKSGKEITFKNCTNIFINWVIEYYTYKKVKYFITNNYTIFPIEKFGYYFDISAKYRIKRSGSSDVGVSSLNKISNYINENFDINSISKQDSKLFVITTKNMHNTKFIYENYEYMFSVRGDKYEIRKLSNTFNANVIFSINLKSIQVAQDLECFENELQ